MFISYSHADRAWVWNRLLPRLEAAELKVCIDDRDFEVGIPSLINIERAIDNSKHTLIVMTPAWIASAWAEFESLLVATTDPAARQRRLLPLQLITCQPPRRIAMLTYANFTEPRRRAREFKRLLGQIRHPSTAVEPSSMEPPAFVAGLPITHPRHFFGHERILKRLFDLLKRRPLQNAVVIGPRRSGKTSLLLNLRNIAVTVPEQLRPDQRADWLPQAEQYRWIFVDFQDPRLGSQRGLLRYFLDNIGLPVPEPCDLDRFLDIVSRSLRTPTVILFDEIDVALQRCPELDNSFWEGLRSLATTQVEGNLSFVLAASESPNQLACHNGVGSPFFNIFAYAVTLGPLTELEARKLIASSPIPFPPSDVEWILAHSGRWPILLQILCRERLAAVDYSETGDAWREEGLRQMDPFRHLLGGH